MTKKRSKNVVSGTGEITKIVTAAKKAGRTAASIGIDESCRKQ